MRQVSKHRAFCAFLAFAWMGAASAQSSEEEDLALAYGDKDTVSIATGNKQVLRRAPSTATVITAEDIAAIGATDLDQVLETVPGVHVSNAGVRNFSVYQIRGIGVGSPTNPQVLIMQNGIPMNTLYRGDKGQDWGGLPLENVARIEVIRGPGSALYGSDAFSGVINIITKTAADTPSVDFGARSGSFNSKSAWVQQGGKWGDVDVATYLNVASTDGSKEIVAADAQTSRDRRFGTNASLAPGPTNNGYNAVNANVDFGLEKWRLRAGYKLTDKLGTGTGISSALDPVGWNKGARTNADLSWIDPQFAQNWGVGFTGSYLHYTEDEYLQLAPPGSKFTASGVYPDGSSSIFPNGMIGNPGRKERQLRFSGYADNSSFAGHALRIGIGHDDLNMYETSTHKNYLLNAAGAPEATAFMDYGSIQPHQLPQRRMVDYLYVQDEWNMARDWTLTAGVRHDHYSDFGGTTNPRLALVWDVESDLTAKLFYGEAFRAPSFTEEYGINPVANGNPNLKPETIRTLETAFTWQARSDTLLNLNFFHYNISDTITVVNNVAPATGASFQNVGKQYGNGMELETVWDATRTIRLSGNYSYQKSIDESTNQDSGYAPHHHLYVRADWSYSGEWMVSGQANRVADRHRPVGDVRSPLPGYTTVDLTVHSTRSMKMWDFAASVRNLFNADVREPSAAPGTLLPYDLPMPRRSVWLQATYKL